MPDTNRIPAAVSTLLRFFFAVVFGVTGFLLGRELDLQLIALHLTSSFWQNVARFGTPVFGAMAGVASSPFAQRLFERELAVLETASEYLSATEIIGATAGFCIGLVGAMLARQSLAGVIALGGDAGDAVAVLVTCLICAAATYIGLRVGARERRGVLARNERAASEKVLDTSAIIDGRIVDIVRSGFIDGTMIVPRFVLVELQAVSDSSDPLRRARGRRGLELLNDLRGLVNVEILEESGESELEVDARLVRVAKARSAKLVTCDFNLNRVATVEGVSVLNVNELSQALRPALQAGEELIVTITREGREANQGVAYLDDGTMIVVDGGRTHKGEDVPVMVTSVIQTAAGRMIFAKLRG